jgi:hypothetical protein
LLYAIIHSELLFSLFFLLLNESEAENGPLATCNNGADLWQRSPNKSPGKMGKRDFFIHRLSSFIADSMEERLSPLNQFDEFERIFCALQS